MKLIKSKILLFLLLLFVSACSNNQSILDNNIGYLKDGSVTSKTLEKLEVKESSKEYLMFNQELSRIYFITNNPDNTLKYSKLATDYYIHLDDKAVITAGSLTNGLLSSTIGSDSSLNYTGSDYERSFDYFYSALSYLRNNNINDAMIDIRASSDIQKMSAVKREARIAKAQNEINKKQSFSLSRETKSILDENNRILSSTQKSFLNGYIYYISGNIRELYGDKNGALVDYKQALSISPKNAYIQQDALRLSKGIDYSYYNDLSKTYKDNNSYNYNQQATVIVVYEQGFLPEKKATKAKIIVLGSFYSIALPSYPTSNLKPSIVSVEAISNKKTQTKKLELITNVYDMAKNSLAEEYPMILTRQASRITSKAIMQESGRKNQDSALGSALYLTGFVSSLIETADLRSFRTLPHFVEVSKINSDEAIDKIRVSVDFNKSIEFENLKVVKGETAIVYIIDTGKYIYKSLIYKSNKL